MPTLPARARQRRRAAGPQTRQHPAPEASRGMPPPSISEQAAQGGAAGRGEGGGESGQERCRSPSPAPPPTPLPPPPCHPTPVALSLSLEAAERTSTESAAATAVVHSASGRASASATLATVRGAMAGEGSRRRLRGKEGWVRTGKGQADEEEEIEKRRWWLVWRWQRGRRGGAGWGKRLPPATAPGSSPLGGSIHCQRQGCDADAQKWQASTSCPTNRVGFSLPVQAQSRKTQLNTVSTLPTGRDGGSGRFPPGCPRARGRKKRREGRRTSARS